MFKTLRLNSKKILKNEQKYGANKDDFHNSFTWKILSLIVCLAFFVNIFSVGYHGYISKAEELSEITTESELAEKINSLPEPEEINIDNAIEVLSQIHEIDRIKGSLDEEDLENQLETADINQYDEAVEAITVNNFSQTSSFLGIGKAFVVQDLKSNSIGLDLSKTTVSFQITNVDKNVSQVITMGDINEETPLYTKNSDGWSVDLPVENGNYVIKELDTDKPYVINDEIYYTTEVSFSNAAGNNDEGFRVEVLDSYQEVAASNTSKRLYLDLPTKSLEATYGQSLRDLSLTDISKPYTQLNSSGSSEVEGDWSWEAEQEESLGGVTGENIYRYATLDLNDKYDGLFNFNMEEIDSNVAEIITTNDGSYIKLKVPIKVTPAIPTYEPPDGVTITSIVGEQLSKVPIPSDVLGTPTNSNNIPLSGNWAWSAPDTSLKNGANECYAVFTPEDTTNYNWSGLDEWDSENNCLKVKVTINCYDAFAHPDWGTPEDHAGITHYVDAEGMTSVEISPENTDEKGIVWLREESYDPDLGRNTVAWYGLDNSSGIFQKGSRFYVQWLNEQEHPEAFENIDEETRAEVENNNGWLFEVGVIAPDGTPYKQLEETIDFYVQIGDDWDEGDLEGFYITLENDESVPVRYGTTAYPEGTDEFGIMALSHFSPYFIYDKLSDEEKAAFDTLSDEEKAQLDAAAKEFAAQQEEKATEANEISNDESTETGDEITYFTISGLGLIMTLALGLMVNSKANKKRFDE